MDQLTQLLKIVHQYLKNGQKSDKLAMENLPSFTNTIYKFSLKDSHVRDALILKIFKASIPQFTDNSQENKIVTQLNHLGCYPKIYEQTDQYRIEEFLNGQIPTYTSLSVQQLIEFTRKLGLFSVNSKIQEKESKYQISNLYKTYKKIGKESKFNNPEKYGQCQNLVKDILRSQIFQNIGKIVPKEMVVSHNDCHLGNLYKVQSQLFILDYEFSGYNYRGYDIGNFFNEYASDYSGKFCFLEERELSSNIKKSIIREYYGTIKAEVSEEEAEYEVQVGRMLSHLFWFFIGLKQINDLPDLDMIGYIRIRHEQFFKFYQKLI